jgi:hypothetical protein
VNVEHLGQDVVRFAPLLDVISPMAYPASFAENEYYKPGVNPRSRMYYLVYRTLTGYRKLSSTTPLNTLDIATRCFDTPSCPYLQGNIDICSSKE